MTNNLAENQPAIFQFIKQQLDNNDVVLFMKGTQKFPMCGFSGAVVAILNNLGVKFKDFNILESEELRQGIKDYADWPTIPQLFIKGEFIGGADITREMFNSGELQALLKEKQIIA
ncbi:MAG: Grx4 family monothiol glutaredoxin [Rickettsiales bacterium]|nr:Grx4 family monothiol glutaredoxin [Rickettsiales bacterium]